MPARAKLPPGKGKRVPLNMRTTREVRNRLETAAADSGRSLVQEVEYRLEHSFQEEDSNSRTIEAAFEDKATFRFMVFLARAKAFVEEQARASKMGERATLSAVRECLRRLIDAWLASSPDPFGDIGLLSEVGTGKVFGAQRAEDILQHFGRLLAQQAEKKEG